MAWDIRHMEGALALAEESMVEAVAKYLIEARISTVAAAGDGHADANARRYVIRTEDAPLLWERRLRTSSASAR
jgi:hypothetical protein